MHLYLRYIDWCTEKSTPPCIRSLVYEAGRCYSNSANKNKLCR